MNGILRSAGALLLILTAVAHTSHVLVPVYADIYEIRSEVPSSRTVFTSQAIRFEMAEDKIKVILDDEVLEPRRVLEGFRIVTE